MNKCPCCGSRVEPGMMVSLDTNTVSIDGETLKLRPMEAEILKVLADTYPAVAEIEPLCNKVFGMFKDTSFHSIQVHICRINKKIGPRGYRLANVYASGYVLVRPEESRAAA